MTYNYEYERIYDTILKFYINDHPITYPITNNIKNNINKPFSISYIKDKIIISFKIQLTYQEENILDKTVNECKTNFTNNLLEYYKNKKIIEIKNNQDAIEKQGFEYPTTNGFRFDMSVYSTTAWNGMIIAAISGMLPLPTGVRDVNDRLHFLSSVDEVKIFYGTGLKTKALMYGQTAYFINEIKQMLTVTDVINFKDPRI